MTTRYRVIRDIDDYVPAGTIYTQQAGSSVYVPNRPGLPVIDQHWIRDPVYQEYFEAIGGDDID